MAHYVTSLCCLLELPSPITRWLIPHHLLYPPCGLHSTRHHLIQYLSVWLAIYLFPLERKRHDNKGFVFLRLCPQCKQVSGIYKALSKHLLNGHLSPCNSLTLSQALVTVTGPGRKKKKKKRHIQKHNSVRSCSVLETAQSPLYLEHGVQTVNKGAEMSRKDWQEGGQRGSLGRF